MKKPSSKEVQAWCEALKSGDYPQTKGSMQDDEGFCCLGVAVDVLMSKDSIKRKPDGKIFGGSPMCQPKAPEWLKNIISTFPGPRNPMGMNDSGVSFEEIALAIEEAYAE